MNMELFRLINNMAYKNKFLDSIMLFFSKDMIYVFAGFIVVLFLLGVIKRSASMRIVAVNTVVFTLINLILAYFIGFFYYVDRPFVNNKVNLLYPHPADASFPSDHATVTMSTTLGINKLGRGIGIILVMLSIVVGFSRVYVGHHSPADIMGTYGIVIIMSALYNFILRGKVSCIYERIERLIVKKLKITWLYEK